MTTEPKTIARLRELHNTVYTQPMTTEFPSLVTSEYIMLIKQHLASLLSDAERVGELMVLAESQAEQAKTHSAVMTLASRSMDDKDARVQELERKLGIAVGAIEKAKDHIDLALHENAVNPYRRHIEDARTTLSQLKEPA